MTLARACSPSLTDTVRALFTLRFIIELCLSLFSLSLSLFSWRWCIKVLRKGLFLSFVSFVTLTEPKIIISELCVDAREAKELFERCDFLFLIALTRLNCCFYSDKHQDLGAALSATFVKLDAKYNEKVKDDGTTVVVALIDADNRLTTASK